MKKTQRSSTLNLPKLLFFVNGAVWGTFGILSLLRAVEGGSALRWMLSFLMFVNTAAMIWFGVMIVTGRNWISFLAILYMAVNVVLSITDQFGWVDAMILLLNLIILGLLFLARQQMKQTQTEPSGEA